MAACKMCGGRGIIEDGDEIGKMVICPDCTGSGKQ